MDHLLMGLVQTLCGAIPAKEYPYRDKNKVDMRYVMISFCVADKLYFLGYKTQ